MSKDLRSLIRDLINEGDLYDLTKRLPRPPEDPIKMIFIDTFQKLQAVIEEGADSQYIPEAHDIMSAIKEAIGPAVLMSAEPFDDDDYEDY